MRPVLADDILLAARAISAVSEAERPLRLQRWLQEAHWADRYRKRLRRSHPQWGNGSLMARALCEPLAPRGGFGGADLDAIAQVVAALQLWRGRIPFAGRAACPM